MSTCTHQSMINRHGQGIVDQLSDTLHLLFKLSAAPMAGLCAMTLVAVATPASAGTNEYCRQDAISGMRSCSFASMEQCQAMSSGIGGTCYRDPFLPQGNATSAFAYAPLRGGHRAKSPAKHYRTTARHPAIDRR